ncbi:MAG: hydrolase [Nocardioides sp.]|nr:hydrolase [Nocardioides sp.]
MLYRSLRPLAAATAGALALGLAAALPSGAEAAPAAPVTAAPVTTAAPATSAAPTSTPARRRDGWTPRRAQFAGTATTTDLAVPMSDGVTLRADLVRPTRADGSVVRRPLPTIVTITAYNKTVIAGGGGLAGPTADYLVRRGYNQLYVDARGTGASEGVWKAFSRREAVDGKQVLAWARRQSWSNGRFGMAGPSYMGINQIFTAAQRPKGLKAIFPQVPAADVYRDVVASGGQIDVGFIPLWLGLVTGTGLIPPAYGLEEPEHGFAWLLGGLQTATTFTVPLMADAILGGDAAYDGEFYRTRSPIEVIDRVDVPTFLVSGEFDLFQRGTPLLFERLRKNGVPTRIITGPWDHLEGSSGAEVGDAGYGSLSELQLRWFDRYVKGREDARLLKDVKPFTYYEQGTGRWVRRGQYVARDLSATTFRLSGDAAAGGRTGGLVRNDARARNGRAVVPAVPVSGLCTRSASQWTAGVLNAAWADNPCLQDNQVNDQLGVVFETTPMKRTLRLQGPLNARLYTSTPAGDGMLSVAVEDVAPNGRVTRLTGGWQTLAHRTLDRSRTRRLDGEVIQPYHPFTESAKRRVPSGAVVPVDVEVFPTGAAIRKGHRLRLSIQAFDVPHLLSTVPDLPSHLVPLTVHTSKRYPSRLVVPTR